MLEKSKVSVANFTFFATFNPKSDIYYLKKNNYDSRIFQLFRVRVG